MRDQGMRTVPLGARQRAGSAEPPKFYSVAQVARMLGMSAMTLYRSIAAGEFPAVRIRSRLIVPARAIEEMIDAAVADQTVVDAADWVVPGSGVALRSASEAGEGR